MCRQKKMTAHFFASIAQSVEHFIRNEKVMGSSPIRGSRKRKFNKLDFLFLFRQREAQKMVKNYKNSLVPPIYK